MVMTREGLKKREATGSNKVHSVFPLSQRTSQSICNHVPVCVCVCVCAVMKQWGVDGMEAVVVAGSSPAGAKAGRLLNSN